MQKTRSVELLAYCIQGFDVDCSCVAFDGEQVYASPRALVAFATQCNKVDLTRRSPSYENRLAKYAARGFEIYCPCLDRQKVDPTIFDRTLAKTKGLARLLVLEKLPSNLDREKYVDERRSAAGRPSLYNTRSSRQLPGDLKADMIESAEWLEEDEVSSYHTFSIPYGPKYYAKKIEKLLYTKDLLLNAEWNRSFDRVNLHRHPAFFGSTVEEALADCCGFCPEPKNETEREIYEEESKKFVRGAVSFIKDNPGRQTIGSFNPTTDNDWTVMAYIQDSAKLCQAIVDCDAETTKLLLEEPSIDVNRRDHCGRTLLHLAVLCSSVEIVENLSIRGAKLSPRLPDGKNALHISAIRGDEAIMAALLDKHEENEKAMLEEEDAREGRKHYSDANSETNQSDLSAGSDEAEDVPSSPEEDAAEVDSMTDGSFVKVKKTRQKQEEADAEDEHTDCDVFDLDAVTIDHKATSLHYAITLGHVDCVKLLDLSQADFLFPLQQFEGSDMRLKLSIVPIVMATRLSREKLISMTSTLLEAGATIAQLDGSHRSALQYFVAGAPSALSTVFQKDHAGVLRTIDHVSFARQFSNDHFGTALTVAIDNKDEEAMIGLLKAGCNPEITSEMLRKSRSTYSDPNKLHRDSQRPLLHTIEQPIFLAVMVESPSLVYLLLENGVNINAIDCAGRAWIDSPDQRHPGKTLLDAVRKRLKILNAPFVPSKISEAEPAENEEQYLRGIAKGSYRMWSAETKLKKLKQNHEEKIENEKESAIRHNPPRSGAQEEAIRHLSEEFKALESYLTEKGALTFEQLHPESQEQDEHKKSSSSKLWKSPKVIKQASFQFSNSRQDAAEKSHEYADLFDATWYGEIDVVRERTLYNWGGNGANPPLEIGTRDEGRFSPLTIAVLKSNEELVKVIVEIADKQFRYGPLEPTVSTRSGNEEGIVNKQDPFGEAKQISCYGISDESPIEIIIRTFQLADYVDIHAMPAAKNFEKNRKYSLLQYTIIAEKFDMFKLLLELIKQYRRSHTDREKLTDHFEKAYVCAIRTGRVRFVEELMRCTGAGLPLDMMVERKDLEKGAKPAYYQGLNVRGKKRKDWAKKPKDSEKKTSTTLSPLLMMASHHDYEPLKLCLFMLSDAPLHLYMQWVEENPRDPRVVTLNTNPDAFKKEIESFLKNDAQTAISHTILNSLSSGMKVIEPLLNKAQNGLESDNNRGRTPLEIACHIQHIEFAKFLIGKGANQECRSTNGDNLLHALFIPAYANINTLFQDKECLGRIRKIINMINPALIPKMLKECSAIGPGHVSPVARMVDAAANFNGHMGSKGVENHVEALEYLLSLSKKHLEDANLEIFNTTGETPLHTAVRCKYFEHVQAIVNHKPALLHVESTTGQTPLELARDAYLKSCFSNPPSLVPRGYQRSRRHSNAYSHKSIAQLKANEFEGIKNKSQHGHRGSSRKVWEFCQEIAEKPENKGTRRKLISLWDTNEVSARLAKKSADPAGWKHHIGCFRGQGYMSDGRYGGFDSIEKRLQKFSNPMTYYYGDSGDFGQLWLD